MGERETGFTGVEHREMERPKHRYLFHGTLEKNVESILTDGFRVKEGLATVSIAPSFTFDKGWADPAKIHEHTHKNNPEPPEFEGEEATILVFEPTSFKGSPVASFMPRETDGEVEFKNHWERYHHGLRSNFSTEQSDPETTLSPDEIVMAIKPTQEFNDILQNLRRSFRKEKSAKQDFIQEFSQYLSAPENVDHDKVEDKERMAEDVYEAELEQFLVTEVRMCFLNIKQHQGKRVFARKRKGEIEPKARDVEKIKETIEAIKVLQLHNNFLGEYRDRSIFALEAELTKVIES